MILELNHKKRSWDYSPNKELQNKYFNLNNGERKDTGNAKKEENLSKLISILILIFCLNYIKHAL
jgi:hypothetical protein